MQRQRRKLTVEDRVAIDLRRKDGWGVRAIARELGRSPSVISTEIGRGREPDGSYAAGSAQAAAATRRDRSGRRLGRAGDRAGAWPFTQRDQYGDWARSGTGRQLRRRVGTGRGGNAAGPVGTSDQAGAGQSVVCRGGESAAAAVVAGADRRQTQAPGGGNGTVVRTTSVARSDLPGDLRRAAR